MFPSLAKQAKHLAPGVNAPNDWSFAKSLGMSSGVTTPDTREMGRYFAAFPFVVGLVWLALQLTQLDITVDITLFLGPWMLVGLALAVPVGGLILRRRGHAQPFSTAALYVALASPLSVILPWVVAPTRIGLGFANFGFFVEWLTRYPNLGPINYEVLFGILCVLGTASLPAFYAMARLWGRESLVPTVLFVLHLVVYVPVVVRLDYELFLVSLMYGTLGPFVFGSGALMRALMLSCMVAGALPRKAVAVAAAVMALAACDSAPPVSSDLRFHTPKATIDTLIETYGLEMVSQEEIRRRMQIGRSFHLVDPATRDLCFADFDGPEDEGLVGYVFGGLAPAKDDVRITQTGDTAHAFGETRDGRRNRPIVLERDDDGAWRIVLEESVPADVRDRLDRVVEEGRNPLERYRKQEAESAH